MTGLSFISIVGILTVFNGSLGFVPPSPSKRFSHHTSTFIPPITSDSTSNDIRVGSIELAAKKKNKSVNKATEADVDELINGGSVATTIAEEQPYTASEIITALDNIEEEEEEVETEEMKNDKQMMLLAINMASSGGERGSHGPFPKPRCGAVLVAKDGRVSNIIVLCMHSLHILLFICSTILTYHHTYKQILGKGKSNYTGHAIEFAFQEAGIESTPLREWCVSWPSDSAFRKDIFESTLYVTLEPSNKRQG